MKVWKTLVMPFVACCVLAIPPVLADAPAGMEKVKVKRLDTVYKKPDVDWSRYAGIYVEPLDLTGVDIKYPRDTKKRDQKPLSEKSIAQFKELYHKAFTRELSEDGFLVAESAAKEGALVLKARVLEIAPTYVPDSLMETSGRNRVYAETAGKMTIQFDFVDGKTGELLVQATDKREPTRQWREINSVQVRSQVNQLMGSWARIVRTNLEDVIQPQGE